MSDPLVAALLFFAHVDKVVEQSQEQAVVSVEPMLNWGALINCESGGDYRTNTGNGFYGAYQFDLETWKSVGGTGLPSAASPELQDSLAHKLYEIRGTQPWPACGDLL